MFRITAPSDEARREPVLRLDPGVTAAPPDPLGSPDPPGFDIGHEPPFSLSAQARARFYGPIGSLLLHLLPLLLLLDWPVPVPSEIAPITVQLVVEPPPEPKSTPQPEKKPPPQQGRLASDDFGDSETKENNRANSDAPAPAKAESPTEATPNETEQKIAAMVPPPAPVNPSLPKDEPAPRPSPKPSPTVHRPPKQPEELAHPVPRRAKFPGPAATRDEYLAYLLTLTRQHLNLLPMAVIGDRRGVTVIDLLVLDDGTIGMLRVGQSSGYPDIDRRVEQIIAAIGHFPPLPQWIQGPSMQLEFRLRFPEALRE